MKHFLCWSEKLFALYQYCNSSIFVGKSGCCFKKAGTIIRAQGLKNLLVFVLKKYVQWTTICLLDIVLKTKNLTAGIPQLVVALGQAKKGYKKKYSGKREREKVNSLHFFFPSSLSRDFLLGKKKKKNIFPLGRIKTHPE